METGKVNVKKVAETFRAVFNSEEDLIVRSPGRVNIIGEHTDYNEGFVLPAAIDKAIYVAVSKRTDNDIHLYAVDFNEGFHVSIQDMKPVKSWPTYILGVADQLIKRGHSITGFNLVVDGDVPPGAGLSSSAAVECATAFALNELFDLGIERVQMVDIAQKAEHTFSGVRCGVMDMFASLFGKKDHVIKLDCRSLQYEYEPFKLDGYKIVLLNTNVKHSLASSAYNTRRQQCEQGVAWVKAFHPEVNSLRDISVAQLEKYVLPKDENVFLKNKFVVEEIQRLQDGCIDLQNGNIQALGKKMFATHEGLSKLYEVSCAELDFLVDAVKDNPAVIGARMMGGGFGGCTINIAKEENVAELIEKTAALYQKQCGKEMTAYVATISDGTSVVKTTDVFL